MIIEVEVNFAPLDVVWKIVGISLVMFAFSQWFSRRFKVSPDSQLQIRMQTQDLQDRLKAAQEDHNPELTAQLNAEMMNIMKEMYKKQLLPMLIRSVVFFGIFGLMNLLYGGYDKYIDTNFLQGSLFALYVIVSFGASAVLMLIRYAIKKIHPPTEQKEEVVIDKLGALQSNIILNHKAEGENTENNSAYTSTSEDYLDANEKREKGWKDRI